MSTSKSGSCKPWLYRRLDRSPGVEADSADQEDMGDLCYAEENTEGFMCFSAFFRRSVRRNSGDMFLCHIGLKDGSSGQDDSECTNEKIEADLVDWLACIEPFNPQLEQCNETADEVDGVEPLHHDQSCSLTMTAFPEEANHGIRIKGGPDDEYEEHYRAKPGGGIQGTHES